jgi:hypothetical protein
LNLVETIRQIFQHEIHQGRDPPPSIIREFWWVAYPKSLGWNHTWEIISVIQYLLFKLGLSMAATGGSTRRLVIVMILNIFPFINKCFPTYEMECRNYGCPGWVIPILFSAAG